MKYSTIKRLEIIFAAAFTVLFGVIMIFVAPHHSFREMILPVVFLCVLISPIFYLDHIERKQYPHWENLWRIPPMLIAMMALLAAAMIVLSFLDIQINFSWMIIPIVFMRCIAEAYYSVRFDMDNVHSLEELLQAHPDARKNLRKVILGG